MGHSQANIHMPMTKLMICNVGKGFTAPSNNLVAKSQKIFGQKNASIAAAIWSECTLVKLYMALIWFASINLHDAAVRIMSLAKWFLISLPILLVLVDLGLR